jgi:3-isopropylmalate/(R)-2-methylmalate dehydratase small subunit
MIFTGRVFKFGDNIDTDVIIPARYLVTTDPRALAKHCMEDVSDTFAGQVSEGDIIIGGANFGCGSSREQAVVAIQGCGVSMVLARSFARIFYRNCINRGLYALEVPDEVFENISEGTVISVDIEKGQITAGDSGMVFSFRPIPMEMRRIIDAGGIIPYTKKKLNNSSKGGI